MKTWWLSNEEAMNLRSENGWTIDLQPHIVTAATHDDDDTAVVADEETYETHYGLRDPMLDVLRRSYLHAWTIKGAHARFVTYAEHTAKCKAATILSGRPPHSTGGSRKKKKTMRSLLTRMSSYHRKRVLFDMKARCMVCFAL